MKIKNIQMSQKKDLKVLVEDYLERDYSQLETFYDHKRSQALIVFSRIFQLLCDPADDYHDLTPDELKGAILEWHQLLTPVWKKIRGAYSDYRENILPDREHHRKMIAALNDPSSPLSEYKDITSEHIFPSDERVYSFKIRRSPITVNLSFDSDKFFIATGGIRVIDNFLLQLKDAPIDIFSICDHCGKIIVATRKGKRYHRGCAAKEYQREKWRKDPDGCKEKERQRYRRKRR